MRFRPQQDETDVMANGAGATDGERADGLELGMGGRLSGRRAHGSAIAARRITTSRSRIPIASPR